MKNKFVLASVICFFSTVSVFESNANANIYISGTDGYGLSTDAYSFPNSASDHNPAPRGIVTYYKDAANAIINGTMGTSFSSANTTFSVNADSLGLIENDTIGLFSQLMFGSVSRPGGLNSRPVNYAFLSNVFGTFFITSSYYEYSVSFDFSNYTSKSTAQTFLQNRDTLNDVFRAQSDLSHTVNGYASGILAPGRYLFESSIVLSAFYPNSFDDNSVNTTLTLTPITAPVPEPETMVLFAVSVLAIPSILKRTTEKKRVANIL